MLIGKMFSLGSTTGLALALARRFRAFFWTLIGGVCLLALTGQKRRDTGSEGRKETAEKNPGVEPVPSSTLPSANEVAAAIFPTGLESNGGHFRCSLARVGTLPILLRTIFAAQKAGFTRIMVVADPVTKRKVRRELFFTGRLPEAVQWIEMNAGASLSQTLRVIANRVP